MKWTFKLIFSIVLWSAGGLLMAQDQEKTFTLSGEYRLNPLYSDGFRFPRHEGEKAEGYVNQRTRIIMHFDSPGDLETKIIFQDLRSWGTYKNNGPAGNFSFFRAWAQKRINQDWSVKFGRQGFIYDDQFILGGLNWGGNMAHDAALVKYETDGFKVHAAFAYNSNGFDLTREAYEYKNHKTMQFLWLSKEADRWDASAIILNRGLEKPDNSLETRFEQTIGGTVNVKLTDQIGVKGVYYHQFGTDTVGSGRDINAYLYSLQASFKASDKFKFTLGADIVSGADMSNEADASYSEKNNFDILYGLRHGHFGYLDYFYVKLWPVTGLEDYYLKTKIGLGEKTDMDIHLHGFMSNGEMLDPADASVIDDNYYGSELDLKLNYKQSSTFKVTFGYSKMWTTDTFEAYYGNQETKGSSVLYAVVVIKPTFIKTSFK